MPDALDLNRRGVQIYRGHLYNHDYLWFSSTEIGQVSTTLPVLHNYALSYALSGFSWAVSPGLPQYQADLAHMRIYALPTELWLSSFPVARTAITYNAVDSITLRTDIGPNVNTPNLGKRVYLDPIFESPGREDRGYPIFAFVFTGAPPPAVFRLGKKGAPMRARWHEVERPRAEYSEDIQQVTHLLNPLDVSGNIIRFEQVTIPPHLLLRSAAVQGDWFVRSGRDVIHVPRLVHERMHS